MPTERRRPARLDGRHRAALVERQPGALRRAKHSAVAAKNIGAPPIRDGGKAGCEIDRRHGATSDSGCSP
jgi:hypothetical protein